MSTEAEIVAQLAKQVPREAALQDTPKPQPAPVREPVPQAAPSIPLVPNEAPDNPLVAMNLRNEIMDYFDIENSSRRSAETQHWVNDILNYVRQEVGDDPAAILKSLQSIERNLGTKLNSRRVYKLWQFTKIRGQKRLLEQREKALRG